MIVGGVLGPIKAYFGTVVSQGRVPRSWNTPPRLSRDNIYVVLSTMNLTGLQQNIYGPNNIISTLFKVQFVPSILHVSALPNKLLQTPTRNQSTFVINASYNESKVIPACLPTPNPSSPNFASRFRADVVQLVEASNIHKHSDTCYKYWNTNKDDKKSCWMRMPRKLVPISTIDPNTDISIDRTNRQLTPFLCATPHLVQLNAKWQKQLKIEKERVRRSLIIGNYDKDDDTLDLFAIRDAVVTVVNPNNYSTNNFENYGSILPVLKVIHNFPTQASIINEFTLNREQRAAFMIITSHLDGDNRCRISIFTIHVITNRNIQSV
ncbi:unnamed protein product [Rotaria sordida]|uniref:Uncharacterized protein n=1 Tax=Rotaria sordida TaxID=392033 RepID=A0A814C207_9BILA|nr:unnamed protein product [Rotaria sordida]